MSEYNLVQAPELLRRIAQRLGIRQSHVSPSLNEGLQAVVVVDDLSRDYDPATGTSLAGEARRLVTIFASLAGAAGFESTLEVSSRGPRFKLMKIAAWTPDQQTYEIRVGWRATLNPIGAQAASAFYTDSTRDPTSLPITDIATAATFTFAQPTNFITDGHLDNFNIAGPGLTNLAHEPQVLRTYDGAYFDGIIHQPNSLVRRLIVSTFGATPGPAHVNLLLTFERQT